MDEAAQEAGVGRATVFRWIKRGWLKRYYLSLGVRRTAVDMDALRALKANPPIEPAKGKK